MPDTDLGKNEKGQKVLVSCHMVARALAHFFPVKCKDGTFGKSHGYSWDHSWLVTKKGLTIDAYPVGVIGGPILIDTRYMTPWYRLYKEERLPKLESEFFLKNIEKVTEVVRQTIETLGIEIPTKQ